MPRRTVTSTTARRPTRQRLTREDWIDAALSAIAQGGVDAVAVEPLAATLGATKGSFYWHFANRQALVDAALERWEAVNTDAVIAAMEQLQEPVERLAQLVTVVLTDPADRLDLALLTSVHDPAVAAAVARVTQRRVDYVAALYRAAGTDAATADSWAVAAVSLYLGHLQLAYAAPGTLPSGDAWAAHLRQMRHLLRPSV